MSLSLLAFFVLATTAVTTFAEDTVASSASNVQSFSVGDEVVSLIDWAGGSGYIARGDVGRAVAQRENDKLVVDFPHIKGLNILLHQIGKVGAPLKGGFILGEKVVSLIDWEGASGRVAKGDVGVALGSGVGNGVLCDFPNIKSLNIMVVQIRKASVEAQPLPKVEPLRPAAVSAPQLRKDPAAAAPLATASDSVPVTVSPPAEAAATVPPVAAEAGSAAVAPLGVPSGASLAAAQAGAAEAVPVTVAPLASGEAVPVTVAPSGGAAPSGASFAAVQGDASEAVPVTQAPPAVAESVPVTVAPLAAEGGDLAALQSLASSLSQKVAKAKEAAEAAEAAAVTSVQAQDSDPAGLEGLQALATSLGKKLGQAKANREDAEAVSAASRDAVARHRSSILVADPEKTGPGDSGVFQRLGSLLGKRRDEGTAGDGDVMSFVQVGAEVDKRALLQKGRKRHEEL